MKFPRLLYSHKTRATAKQESVSLVVTSMHVQESIMLQKVGKFTNTSTTNTQHDETQRDRGREEAKGKVETMKTNPVSKVEAE